MRLIITILCTGLLALFSLAPSQSMAHGMAEAHGMSNHAEACADCPTHAAAEQMETGQDCPHMTACCAVGALAIAMDVPIRAPYSGTRHAIPKAKISAGTGEAIDLPPPRTQV